MRSLSVPFLVALAPAIASATPGAVSNIFPVNPFRPAAKAMLLGFDTTGSPAQLQVTVSGASALAGAFGTLNGALVSPSAASTIPFELTVGVPSGIPSDAVITVTATPVGADGSQGSPLTTAFSAAMPPPTFASSPISATTTSDGSELLVTGSFSGPVQQGTLTVLGVSSQVLREFQGASTRSRGLRSPAVRVWSRGRWHPRPVR